MKFLLNQKGILLVAFIGLFVFVSLAISGVFGSTQLGLILRTNQDLQRGLVGHWTFDSTDVNGFTVSDSSGNGNDGVIVATTSASAEDFIESGNAGNAEVADNVGPDTVWTNDDNAYKFYMDGSFDLVMATTTDGGSTWTHSIPVTDIYPGSNYKVAIWYDKWSPNDDGNKIHITFQDGDLDVLHYVEYDIVANTFSTAATATPTGATPGGSEISTITKSENDVLYVALHDGANGVDTIVASCGSNCTETASWTSITHGFGASDDDGADGQLFPVVGTDNVIWVYRDENNDHASSIIYSATSSSWFPKDQFVTSVEVAGSGELGISSTYDKASGVIYTALLDDADDYVTQDHDIDVWKFDPATLSWSELTSPVTNASGGLEHVSIAIDENRPDHLYLLYTRRTTITENYTAGVYWRLSTDAGQTWSAEAGPLDSASVEEMEHVHLNFSSDEKIVASYEYTAGTGFYSATVADIGDYADEKQVAGAIGQGMTFDGIEDYVNLDSPALLDDVAQKTWAVWMKLDSHVGNTSSLVNKRTPGTEGPWFGICNNSSDAACSGRFNTLGYMDGFSSTDGRWSTGDGTIELGEWTHVAVSFDDSSDTNDPVFYINGEISPVVGETAPSGPGQSDSSRDVLLGGTPSGGVMFDGQMDDFRFYNRILRPEEVKRLYQLGATTKIGKTLNTNPDLEDGLVGHWTFDSTDVSGFDVLDRSGNSNDGYIVATSSSVETVIAHDGLTNSESYKDTGPSQVWLSDDVGYMFYINSSREIMYASTTDGGDNWASTTVDTQGDGQYPTIWYDKWTPGDDGDLIHIAFGQVDDGEVYYMYLDTTDNSTSTVADLSGQFGLTDGVGDFSSVMLTKAEDGTLYAGSSGFVNDNFVAYCLNDCLTSSSWTHATGHFGNDGSEYHSVFLPIKGTNNIMNMYYEFGDVDLSMQIYSATSSSWQDEYEIANDGGFVTKDSMGAAMYRNTGDIYLVAGNDTNDYVTQDHDIDVWKYDVSAQSWNQQGEPLTDMSGGLDAVKIAVDQNNGDLYVVYNRRATIGDVNTGDIYYQVSTDEGVTWSGEIGPVNGLTSEEIVGLSIESMPFDKLNVYYKYEDSPREEDIYHLTIFDLGEDPEDKLVPGNIGQGLYFDGVNDGVNLGDLSAVEGITTVTVSAWVKNNKPFIIDTGSEFIVEKTGAGTDTFDLFWGQGEDVFFCVKDSGDTGQCGEYTNGIEAGNGQEWHHVTGVYDGSEVRVYVNGEVGNSPAANTDPTNNSSHDLQIGSVSEGNGWDGILDDVRIYDRALSQEEVTRLYDIGATTKINKTLDTNPDLERGLVAHYTFDGYPDTDISSTTGEVHDVTESGHEGNAINFDDITDNLVPGVIGQAMDFDGDDGTGDRLAISDDPAFTFANAFTSALWIRPDDAPVSGEWYVLTKKRRTASDSWQFNMYNNSGSHYISGGVDTGAVHYGFTGDTLIEMGEWYHVVMSWDGSEVRAYVNGELDITPVATAGSMVDTADDVAIAWGTSISDPSFEEFDGRMDDIRFYDRALSAEEIRRLYQLGGQ